MVTKAPARKDKIQVRPELVSSDDRGGMTAASSTTGTAGRTCALITLGGRGSAGAGLSIKFVQNQLSYFNISFFYLITLHTILRREKEPSENDGKNVRGQAVC